MSACPPMDTLFALAAGELSAADAAALRAHVAGCAECARRLAVASGPPPEPRLSPTVTSPGLIGAAARPPLGTVGRYRVLRELGRGAMGVVLLAEDTLLGRQVALKAVGAAGPDGRLAHQVSAEARAIARLQHPNVVGLFDVLQQDGQVYLAMEYVEGGDVTGWLATPRSPQQVLALFLQAAAGLEAAHEAGVVHRDFKPANVLVGTDGRARVSDFGLAAMQGEHDAALPGSLVGTPAFMAPEQLAGKRASPAADQFAFCTALAFALTGRLPHAANTLDELRAAVLRGPPIEFPGVAPAVAAVLRRGLAVDPQARFPSMRELGRALRVADAAPRRRRLAIGAVALALFGVGSAAVALRPRDTCRLDDARLAQVLPPPASATMAQALRTALDASLSAWRDEWTSQCRDAAEGRTSATEWQRARSCLDAALEDVETVVEVARRAEPGKPVASLLQYVATPRACASPRVPGRSGLPAHPEARQHVVSAHLSLVDVAQAVAKRDVRAAAAHAQKAEEHALASGHPQTQARALLVSARLRYNANERDEANRLLDRAVSLAQASGALREVAQASFQKAFALCQAARPDCGEELARMETLAAALQAPWLQASAVELRAQADFRGPMNRELLAEAVTRWRSLPGAEVELARAQRAQLFSLLDQKRFAEALALSFELLPEGHALGDLTTCELAIGRARAWVALGRGSEAMQLFQDLLRAGARLGLENVRVDAAMGLAPLLLEEDRSDAALALLPADSVDTGIQAQRMMAFVQLGAFAEAERILTGFVFPPSFSRFDNFAQDQAQAAQLLMALERNDLETVAKGEAWLADSGWVSLEVAVLAARGLETEARALLRRQPDDSWLYGADLAMREHRWADALTLLEKPPMPVPAVERVDHQARLAWTRAMLNPGPVTCREAAAQRARVERHRIAFFAPDRARFAAELKERCR